MQAQVIGPDLIDKAFISAFSTVPPSAKRYFSTAATTRGLIWPGSSERAFSAREIRSATDWSIVELNFSASWAIREVGKF
jgi:hypothetical protein